ncbi:extracellular solute-binding protein [Phragmitibacter flavus]|uniref:Extracellular solute-binding protein n=1 Tax=Phragmitibacter flavus TaxID=2576071 RepID=A0A5R8KI67_9BACT|nr:extracellular solute-binding protein [Phragmitibacter flavus]TLD71309.1 extracellular solute-binding protein [Phragmitibacter flavus]
MQAFLKRTFGRKRAAWLLLGASVIVLASCGERPAKNELVVYSAGPREMAESICKEFERRSGVPTRLFSATTGEIMAKLAAEEFRPQADVVILAGQTAAEVLREQELLAPLPEGDYLKMNPAWNDPDGFYAATGACALGVAVPMDRKDVTLDWPAIFDGAIEGKFIMPSPSQSGSSAEFVVSFHLNSPELFWNGMRGLKKRGLQVSGPNNQALTSLILGAHEGVMGAADYLVFRQMEKGEPLAMHFPPSGCPLSLRPICILASSRNLAAAEDFVEFCFTKEVQSMIAAMHLLPADPEVELSEQRRSAPELRPLLVDVREARKAQQKALHQFRYEIEKGVR